MLTLMKKTVNSKDREEEQSLNLSPEEYSLLTDLYQLTMIACYVGEGVENRPASFELFTRHLPQPFTYVIAMGLAQVLEYLEKLHFTPHQIEQLQATGIFTHAPDRFWQLLEKGCFTGDVWASPEGTALFANEPFLRIEAPLWQAQLVETYLLNTINYQTLIATRAARLREITGSEVKLWELGTRRAFSPQASLWAARAALAGGFDGTSNVLAALKLGCNPMGTMAHALVMALSAIEGSESAAFTAFHHYFPGAPLLIDTYDSIAAAEQLSDLLKRGELTLTGVRLDSGDLVSLSQEIRELLPGIPILASGDLDESEIWRLQQNQACIDAYGLGTKLVTGNPVNGVYKLVEIDQIPVMKESPNKKTYPGKKQIFRLLENGHFKADILGLNDEFPPPSTVGLMKLVMEGGQRVHPPETLETIALRTAQSVASLPLEIRHFPEGITFNVTLSPSLEELTKTTLKNSVNVFGNDQSLKL